MAETQTVQRTPLYDAHVSMGGRMVDFAGWDLPICFTSINEEHAHTRTSCSVFDVSHMGRLSLTGKDCQSFLNRLCTRKLDQAEVGRSYYSHVCKEDGGILDDVIVSRFEKRWGIVCNASNREKIVAWIEKQSKGMNVSLKDQTTSTAMIAMQGPKTLELANAITGKDLSSLKRYRCTEYTYLIMKVSVYRCGYTGEDGFEVVVPASAIKMMLPKLFGSKGSPNPLIKPAGLGARDTLRIEAAMPLYGHELSEDWDSLTAGQSWCVDLEKDFIGSDAMRKNRDEGLPRQLVGLELDGKRIARQHYKVFADGKEVGEVTSGTLGPTLGKSIAMAFVSSDVTEVGTTLEIEMGSKRTGATVVKLPFYKRLKK